MPTWPLTLPAAPLAEGFRETMPATTVRTEMEAGPAKVRRRTTAGVGRLSMAYLMSAAQVATLESFVTHDLAGGALPFNFTHPRRGTAVRCRFARLPEHVAVNAAFFKSAFELEILP